MLRIKILTIGKIKEEWLELALHEYMKRLQAIASFEFILAKHDEQLVQLAEKEPNLICLDVKGANLISEQFATFIQKKLEQNGSRLTFLIGGAEGLPAPFQNRPDSISLSPLTFTHQLSRLILIEQLYRAFEIAKGSRYHK